MPRGGADRGGVVRDAAGAFGACARREDLRVAGSAGEAEGPAVGVAAADAVVDASVGSSVTGGVKRVRSSRPASKVARNWRRVMGTESEVCVTTESANAAASRLSVWLAKKNP
jgi:basic membrane lipoprotein Med (substrate-binding protein (PBP1-ABC) superfamily)